MARLPSSGRSAACPHAESAVLLHRLSVLPPAEHDGGPPNEEERDWQKEKLGTEPETVEKFNPPTGLRVDPEEPPLPDDPVALVLADEVVTVTPW